jgi:hypothetical protein
LFSNILIASRLTTFISSMNCSIMLIICVFSSEKYFLPKDLQEPAYPWQTNSF